MDTVDEHCKPVTRPRGQQKATWIQSTNTVGQLHDQKDDRKPHGYNRRTLLASYKTKRTTESYMDTVDEHCRPVTRPRGRQKASWIQSTNTVSQIRDQEDDRKPHGYSRRTLLASYKTKRTTESLMDTIDEHCKPDTRPRG